MADETKPQPEVEWLSEEYAHVPDEEPCALLQELWDKGLIYLANHAALHVHGYALGVDQTDGKVTGLMIYRTGDPEGVWFDEELTRIGRQKLLDAGLIDGAHRPAAIAYPCTTHKPGECPPDGEDCHS